MSVVQNNTTLEVRRLLTDLDVPRKEDVNHEGVYGRCYGMLYTALTLKAISLAEWTSVHAEVREHRETWLQK